jgi:hypothetical protein
MCSYRTLRQGDAAGQHHVLDREREHALDPELRDAVNAGLAYRGLLDLRLPTLLGAALWGNAPLWNCHGGRVCK